MWSENLYRLEPFSKMYPKQTHYIAITAKKPREEVMHELQNSRLVNVFVYICSPKKALCLLLNDK